jgi:polysaccharide biosynthesis/export protein
MKTLLIAMLLFSGRAQQPPAQTVPPPQTPPAPRQAAEPEYVVGVGDVLTVKVFGEDTYSRDAAPVEQDGMIEVLEIGRMPVSGKTTRQIAQEIADEYAKRKILLKPNVSVTVRDYRSQQVWMTGQVRNPGAIQLKGNTSLMKALSDVEYFTQDAGPEIHIYRAKPGQDADTPAKPTGKPDQVISREDVDSGVAGSVTLRNGDTVNVPKAPTFYVSGFVRNPNQFTIRPGLTVWDAVASLAGGLDPLAAKNRIEVTRTENGRTKTFKPKDLMKELVKPDDRINVPKRKF